MVTQLIADTSVWIPFFNGQPSPQADYLSLCITEGKDIFLTPMIVQEILQGIRSDQQFEQVEANILAFTVLEWDATSAAIAAAKLYRSLRKKGVTIRKSNDCLIAAFAVHFAIPILHQDGDFQRMSEHKLIDLVAFSDV
jgi:predicted nucleic acid-binding protein